MDYHVVLNCISSSCSCPLFSLNCFCDIFRCSSSLNNYSSVVFKDSLSRDSSSLNKSFLIRFSISDFSRVVERRYHLSGKVLKAAEKEAKSERAKFEDIQVYMLGHYI